MAIYDATLDPVPPLDDKQLKTWLNSLRDEVIDLGRRDFYLDVARGLVPGHSIVHKFGSRLLTTTPSVVAYTGAYQTPTAATALEFVSDDVNDTSTGSGAREITVTGLDSNWEEVTQTVTTNGTTAVALGTNLIRLYRWYVSSSGSYAGSTAASHAGNLTIQVSGGGTVWSTIPNSPIPYGQSVIGAYTVPKGKAGYILSKNIFVDTTKTADIYFFKRENADDVTAPYSGTRRLVEREVGVQGGVTINFDVPKDGLTGPCDIGFIGSVSSGTADCSVEFEILLVDE